MKSPKGPKPTPRYPEFAARLDAAQREARLSAGVLADRLGTSAGTVSAWRGGWRKPDEKYFTPLVKELGVMRSWLEHGEGPMRPGETAGAAAVDVRLLEDDGEPHGPEYYRGLQRGLMSTMEFVARSLRESIAAHDRAIEMQKEIIANTTPVARPAKVSKGGSPAERPTEQPEKRTRPG